MSEKLDEQLVGDFPAIPKQERALLKRQALLESGRILFAEKGYEQTTAKDIASHADVATGTFYRYFSDKRQLLMALLEDKLEKILPPEPQWGEANPQNLLAAILEEHIKNLQELGLYDVLPELLTKDPQFAEVVRKARQKIYDKIYQDLLLAREMGLIWEDLNLDWLAWAIITLLENTPEKLMNTSKKQDFYDAAKVICRLVLPPDKYI